jgi:hypothetical protein
MLTSDITVTEMEYLLQRIFWSFWRHPFYRLNWQVNENEFGEDGVVAGDGGDEVG